MTTEIEFQENLTIPQNRLLALNIFWWSLILYLSAYVIKTNPHFNLKIGELIQFVSLVVSLFTWIYLSRFTLKNVYLITCFFLLIIWSIIIVSRGIHLNYDSIKEMLIDANFGVVIYIVPLVLLIPQDFFFFKKLFQTIAILGIVFLIFNGLYIKELLDRSSETQDVIEYLTKFLGITSGFILLTYKYHTTRKNLIALAVMILSLLFSIYKARRGLSLICGSILLFSYFLYLFNTKRVILIIYLSFLMLISGLYYASTIYNINNNKLFGFISKRGEEDTRTPVELYFYSDFKKIDWLIGRGINGEYFCPDIDQDQITDYRSYIETGYLEFILKGGIIYLAIYLLILIPAVILGLFNSKNIFSKAAALWIVISFISIYPSTVNTFSLNYLLIWISVGICYSEKIRRLADEEIEFLLKSPLYI
ncbi:MAG: hypothetical protein ACTHK8_21965 [Ginsengibacter sp.]|jgi:hypothetical protein